MKKNTLVCFALALALCGTSLAGCKTDPVDTNTPPTENGGGRNY